MECRPMTSSTLVLLLALGLEDLQYIRILKLTLWIDELYVVRIYRGLEINRSIQKLTMTHIVFTSQVIEALARVVEKNKTITVLKIELQHSGGDNWDQLKNICRGLREAIQANRFIIDLSVSVASENRASDYRIKEALRRNMMLVNQAIRFMHGAEGKTEALAFDALRYAASLRSTLFDYYGTEDDEFDVDIRQARKRLAANYIFYAGIVKSKVECYPHTERQRRGEKTIDILDPECLARVCSYLSLSDVVNP
ncbi:hypothetical protein MTO96_026347 [Rhipicephalus appendiculatus]